MKFDYLILMDGDYEDRAVEIKSLVNKIQSDLIQGSSQKGKRSEFIFKFLSNA